MAGPWYWSRSAKRSILQCVVDNALGVVRPEDIYIVVGYRQDDVYAHLGPKFNYVVQPEALGTGHAMLQVAKVLRNFPATCSSSMATLRSSGPTPFADCSTATS